MRLKHSGSSANLDFYEVVGDEDCSVTSLRYDVDFSRSPDGKVTRIPRKRPRYAITVKRRTAKAWVTTLELVYEPRRKPRSLVLPGAMVARLVHQAKEG